MTEQLTRPDEPARAVETYRRFLAEEVWDYAGYLATYEEDCAVDRREGHRPHYCIHGTNQWTDYDNICGGCEDSLTVWDMAERAAWARHARYLHVLDQLSTVSRSHDQHNPVPTYVTDAYVTWLLEVGPTPVSPANTEED
jgi:hypothetical protein